MSEFDYTPQNVAIEMYRTVASELHRNMETYEDRLKQADEPLTGMEIGLLGLMMKGNPHTLKLLKHHAASSGIDANQRGLMGVDLSLESLSHRNDELREEYRAINKEARK